MTAHRTVTVTNAKESLHLKMVKVAKFIIYIYMLLTFLKEEEVELLAKAHSEGSRGETQGHLSRSDPLTHIRLFYFSLLMNWEITDCSGDTHLHYSLYFV